MFIGVWREYSEEFLLRVVMRKRREDSGVRWPNVKEMRASASFLEQNIRASLAGCVFFQ